MAWNWDSNFDRTRNGGDAHVDVRERDGQIVVIADIPGIEQTDDIDLRSDGRTLRLHATTGSQSYDNRIRLPVPVDEESATGTYNNGVLEVTFDRADGSR